jgi:hypothetical protein
MRYTLVSDGASDQALMPILEWALRQAGVAADLQAQWADLRTLRHPPIGLRDRIKTAVALYPCELLFVHRDGEGQGPEMRITEINGAVSELRHSGVAVPHVCVVPVRMQEAWLLIDEDAIRTASGNQYGRVQLPLPRPRDLEGLPDPKEVLFALLRTASELSGRRLRKLSLARARLRVAELIDDFSRLRVLTAFQTFEASRNKQVPCPLNCARDTLWRLWFMRRGIR